MIAETAPIKRKRKAPQPKKGKRGGGRPPIYKSEMAQKAKERCLLGATNAQLAEYLGVHLETVKLWLRENPEFLTAVYEGRDGADARVAKGLYQRAIGYSHPDTHISAFQGDITQTPITKHYPPDVTAASWWLRNRRPSQWRDLKAIEVSGPDGGPVEVKKIEWEIVSPESADATS